jgi:glucan endo-1,3-alpha-glucosidase
LQTTDALWAFVMATAPGSVTLNGQTFQVDAGISTLSVSLSPGDTMQGTISRNGQDVVTLAPTGYVFNGQPSSYNFNAFVAASQ